MRTVELSLTTSVLTSSTMLAKVEEVKATKRIVLTIEIDRECLFGEFNKFYTDEFWRLAKQTLDIYGRYA